MNYYNNLDIKKAIENKAECIQLIKDKFGYNGDITTGGFYILPDGTAIKSKDHADVDLLLIKKGYITNFNSNFDYSDGSQFMDALNCIRLRRRGGADAWIMPYVLIPEERPTQAQYNVLFDWLNFVLSKNGIVNVQASGAFANGLSKTFKSSEGIFAEDIIDSIKTYYRTNILESNDSYDNIFDDEIDDTDYELEAGLRKGFFNQFEN